MNISPTSVEMELLNILAARKFSSRVRQTVFADTDRLNGYIRS